MSGKNKVSQQKILASKFKWGLVEKYLDFDMSNGSTVSNKKSITFREFKNYIDCGYSLAAIKKEGVSKHLVGFLSNFAQGKISLDKDAFVKEYHSGKELKEIGSEYGISRDDITFLRMLYGVKRKGSKFIQRKHTEVPLTQRQKDILYGSMMGDAKRQTSSTFASVEFGHSDKQRDYLLWKYREFENIASKESLQENISIDKRTENINTKWAFYTYANTDVEDCLRKFYNSGRKEVNQKILDNLSPLSIAVWYMDDGQGSFGHRKILNGINPSPIFRFCTDSFTVEECDLISKWFKSKYNIEAFVNCYRGNNKPRIQINTRDNGKFIDLIKNYIIPSMKYKIDYNIYLEKRKDSINSEASGITDFPLGVDFKKLDIDKQEGYLNNFIDKLYNNGIEHLVYEEEGWAKHINKVFDYNTDYLVRDGYIDFSHIGDRFLISYFSCFWDEISDSGISQRQMFNNRKYLYDILRNIILQGYYPDNNKILAKLACYRNSYVYNDLMPIVFKCIYKKFSDNNNISVLDIRPGYGGRLLGALSYDKVFKYTGLEENLSKYNGLCELGNRIKKDFGISKEVNLINQESLLELSSFDNKSYDICIFVSERYNNNYLSHRHKKYDSYQDWFDNYFIKCTNEAMRVGKRFVINTANNGAYLMADHLEEYLKQNAITYKKYYIKISLYGGEKSKEPLYIIGD